MRKLLTTVFSLFVLAAAGKTTVYLRPEVGYSLSNVILSATPPPGYIAILNYSYSAAGHLNAGMGLLFAGKRLEVATGVYYFVDGAKLQHIRSIGAPQGWEKFNHIMLPLLIAGRIPIGKAVKLAPGVGFALLRNNGYKNHLYNYNSSNILVESREELSGDEMEYYYKRSSTLFVLHASIEVRMSKGALVTISGRLNNMMSDIDQEQYSDTRIRSFNFAVGYGIKI